MRCLTQPFVACGLGFPVKGGVSRGGGDDGKGLGCTGQVRPQVTSSIMGDRADTPVPGAKRTCALSFVQCYSAHTHTLSTNIHTQYTLYTLNTHIHPHSHKYTLNTRTHSTNTQVHIRHTHSCLCIGIPNHVQL